MQACRSLDGFADGLSGVLVAEEAHLRLFLGPAAVAVHNDSHVLGQAGFVYVVDSFHC